MVAHQLRLKLTQPPTNQRHQPQGALDAVNGKQSENRANFEQVNPIKTGMKPCDIIPGGCAEWDRTKRNLNKAVDGLSSLGARVDCLVCAAGW